MYRSMRPSAIAILALGALAACAGDTAPAAPPAPVLAIAQADTLPGGTIRVTNPGATAWADTSGWRFTPAHTIQPADDSPGALGITDGLAIGGDGAVYALQRKPARILAFDGTFLSAMRTACCYATPEVVADTAGRLWVPGSMLERGLPGWVLMSGTGKRVGTVLMPTDPEIPFPASKHWTAKAMLNGREATAYRPVPLQPKVFSTPRRDGTVIAARNDRAELLVLRGADTLRRIVFPSPAVPLSQAERDSILAASLGEMRKFSSVAGISGFDQGGVEDLPVQWPALTGLSVDRAGRIWVGLGGARGELTRLLVFSPEGVLLGDVPPPHPDFFKGAWGEGDRYALATEDADGIPVIRVFRLRTGS